MFWPPATVGIVNSSGEQTLSLGKANAKSAAGKAVISPVVVLLHPNASVAVSVTSNAVVVTPASKTWLGFDVSAVVPLPKFHVYSSACVLALLNCTVKGEQPAFTSAVKSAVG